MSLILTRNCPPYCLYFWAHFQQEINALKCENYAINVILLHVGMNGEVRGDLGTRVVFFHVLGQG